MNGALWLAWAILLALAISVTRNPFYLALALLAVLSVRIAVNTTRPLGRAAPRFAVLAALVLIGWSTVVNVLLAHVGDRVITRLPPWPVIGGPLTFNALLYGALTGIALATVLIGISLLHAVLDRHEALRLVPGDSACSRRRSRLRSTHFRRSLQPHVMPERQFGCVGSLSSRLCISAC